MVHRSVEGIGRWRTQVTTMLSEGHGRRKILIADDEEIVCGLLVQVIADRVGCKTTTVYSGNEALERLNAESFDVLLTDMMMPGMSGLELISTVRERWPDLDIMVQTVFGEILNSRFSMLIISKKN